MKKITLILFILILGQTLAQDISVSLYGGAVSSKIAVTDDLGFQLSSNAYYYYNKDLTLFLSAGYFSWQEDYGIAGNELQAVPLLIGIRLPITHHYTFPYFFAEMGLEYIKRKYSKGEFEESQTIPDLWLLTSSESRSDSDISFKSRIGVGLLIQVNENLAFDFAFKYSLSNYQYEYYYANNSFFPGGKTKRIFLYDLALGLIYTFN